MEDDDDKLEPTIGDISEEAENLLGSSNDEPVANIVVVPSNRNQRKLERKRRRLAEIESAQNENNDDDDDDVSSSGSSWAPCCVASEDLSSKNDLDLALLIERMSRNVDVLGPKMKDGGAKFKTKLKLYKEEFERRKLRRAQQFVCMSTVMVSQNSKRLCRESADRISNLPSNLILQILQRLPLRDAVRTSVFSKSWSRRWVSLPRVILDEEFYTAFLKGRDETHELLLDYMIVINGILFSHVGPISKFFLYIPLLFPKETAISQWLRYICAKSVEDLIVFNAGVLKTNLSSCLFSCVGLSRLSLVNCKLPSLPATFVGFPSLVILNLLQCAPSAYHSNMLGILISRCPQLKNLNISSIHYFQRDLTICAPKLQYLSLEGKLRSLCFQRTSGTRICNMDVEFETLYNSLCLTDYFICLANVETLTLANSFWKATLHHEFIPPKKFSKQLEQVKRLNLTKVPLNCNSTVSFILFFFETCPNLEQLYVDVADHDDNTVGHLPQLFDALCNLQCLKTVQLTSRIYKSYELQLIKFLLVCSPALEEMTIVISTTTREAEEKFNLANELLQYTRASPKARIVLKARVSEKSFSF